QVMRLLLAGIMLLVSSSLALAVPPPPPPPYSLAYPDIQVATIDDLGTPMELKASLYLPTPMMRPYPMPLLLYIHGKGGAYNDPPDKVLQRVLTAMTNRGFAVARIDYRKSGRMPAMLFDTKAYIRFFRANAAKYNIDPNRIGIWGVSRGGNLAAMLA